jgi:hypothetical protein
MHLPSLSGLWPFVFAIPSAKALGYFRICGLRILAHYSRAGMTFFVASHHESARGERLSSGRHSSCDALLVAGKLHTFEVR